MTAWNIRTMGYGGDKNSKGKGDGKHSYGKQTYGKGGFYQQEQAYYQKSDVFNYTEEVHYKKCLAHVLPGPNFAGDLG